MTRVLLAALLALTATAVLLGVMFVTTTYVLTDTLDESFTRVFEQSLSDVDVVVRGAPVRGDDDRTRMPQSVVDQARGIDGVASARGFVQGYAQLIGRDGEAVRAATRRRPGRTAARRSPRCPARSATASGRCGAGTRSR